MSENCLKYLIIAILNSKIAWFRGSQSLQQSNYKPQWINKGILKVLIKTHSIKVKNHK